MNITLLDVVDNKIKSEILYEERTSLGLNSKVKKKFDKVDAIDNISDYVDLGLPSGTLWCKHNYGADEEYGYGDLVNHEEAMNLDLSPGHLPSKEDFKELYDNCTHTWTCVHGIDGQLFTSKINGKKVFFPASGYRKALTIFGRGFGGNYWSSSIYAFSRSCFAMNFNNSFVKPIDHSFISINYSVRAVISKTNESINLGLNSKVKKKFSDAEAIDNASAIPFEDPEVERICHEHGVYTVDDAAKVDSIKGWFTKNKSIETFNELKLFTSLKTIEEEAFEKCRSLKSINIPDGVTSIECASFYGCSSLQSVTIPDGVYSIGIIAFVLCKSLKTINISKNCPIYDRIRKSYPDIQLIEPKVNEASNLGLNSKVKKKFEKRSENKEPNVSEVSEEQIRDLYDTWGHIPVEWQASHFLTNYYENKKVVKTIGKSFAKFIFDITDGEITFRYNGFWGQENLDAIEFWRTKDKPKVLKNRIYGEELYWDEMKDRFYKRKENFITDWFIPATVEVTKLCPEIRHYFFEKMV